MVGDGKGLNRRDANRVCARNTFSFSYCTRVEVKVCLKFVERFVWGEIKSTGEVQRLRGGGEEVKNVEDFE